MQSVSYFADGEMAVLICVCHAGLNRHLQVLGCMLSSNRTNCWMSENRIGEHYRGFHQSEREGYVSRILQGRQTKFLLREKLYRDGVERFLIGKSFDIHATSKLEEMINNIQTSIDTEETLEQDVALTSSSTGVVVKDAIKV